MYFVRSSSEPLSVLGHIVLSSGLVSAGCSGAPSQSGLSKPNVPPMQLLHPGKQPWLNHITPEPDASSVALS